MNDQPLVSIICPTFNHEKYIAQAIDGFLMQKTSFPFEIIVHDDASTDKTASIAREYEAGHPGLFANIYQSENQLSKNIVNVSRITFAAARGKYIALCEGDDYWTDPLKLQKQIDFLEAHPGYSACFHNARKLDDTGFLNLYNDLTEAKDFTQDELVRSLQVPTASVVFRNKVKEMPQWLLDCFLDITLFFYISGFGDFYASPEVMSVYRVHAGGIWTGQQQEKKMANHIGIRYGMLAKLPLSKTQERSIKQIIVEMRLQRMSYFANKHAYSATFFKDFFNVIKAKTGGYDVAMKYLIFCMLPDKLVSSVNKLRKSGSRADPPANA
jgi:glycosyltransferase involved in cell wall biosynthesis